MWYVYVWDCALFGCSVAVWLCAGRGGEIFPRQGRLRAPTGRCGATLILPSSAQPARCAQTFLGWNAIASLCFDYLYWLWVHCLRPVCKHNSVKVLRRQGGCCREVLQRSLEIGETCIPTFAR